MRSLRVALLALVVALVSASQAGLITQSGPRHFSASSGGGTGPTYTPLFTWSAAGGTPTQAITGWVDTTRLTYSNDVTGPFGGSVTAKQQLIATDHWFGGTMMNSLDSHGLGNGTDIWIRIYMHFPADFRFASGTLSGDRWENVKWIRLGYSTSEFHRLILQLGSLGGSAGAITGTPGWNTQAGWGGFTDEYGGNGWNGEVGSPAAYVTRGGWVVIQSHVRLASDTTGYLESWIGETYQGRATKNGATTYQTISSGGVLRELLLGDWWNGGSGFDDDFYIDEIIITRQTPNTVDSGGRPYIAPSTRVSDFP